MKKETIEKVSNALIYLIIFLALIVIVSIPVILYKEFQYNEMLEEVDFDVMSYYIEHQKQTNNLSIELNTCLIHLDYSQVKVYELEEKLRDDE